MRIVINTRFLLPGRLEGLGRYTHEITRRLVAMRPDVEFVFLFDRPFDQQFIYAENVRPVVLFPPARHPLLWYAWFEWAVPRALKQIQPDLFFSPDAYLSLRSTVPVVLTVHDLVPLTMPDQIPRAPRIYYQHFLPRFIRKADHLLTVSDFVRDEIIELLHIEPSKITTAHNGCRIDFQPLTDDEQTIVRQQYSAGKPYFFYTGSIHPRKNVPRLIRAFDAFKQTTQAPVMLLLAGRFAWQTGEVRQAYEHAKSRADIRFLDYVSDAELPRLMGSALALTYISLNEGFGLPVLEAMHSEVPVLTSNTTALPEVAGNAALLVNPLDEQQITGALRQLWEQPLFRADLVAKGRIQRQQFSWDIAADKISKIIF